MQSQISPQPPAPALLDALFATPACGHCLVDPAGRVVRTNAEWLRSTGFVEAEVLGRDIVSLFPGSEDLSRALHELARAGRQVHVPKHAQLVGGHESWWDGWIAPVPWGDGGTGLLITARELRNDPGPAQGSAMAAVFDSIEDVIYAKDARGRMVYANPATLALIGKPLEEVLGRTDAEFLSDPKAAAAVMDTDRRVMAGGQPVEVAEHVPLPDGTERVWLSRKVPWRDAQGGVIGLLGISRDITQREATGRELRRMRGLMESTLENFPTAIVFKDREGRFIEVNGAAQRLFGRTREELLGIAPHEFLPAAQAERIRADDLVVMATGQALQAEHERTLDGRSWTFLDTMFPLRGEDGSIAGVGYISHDMTAQKRAERELGAVNEQLREAGRQKDQFIANLGHELRNPLAPIRTAAELIRRRGTGDPVIERAQDIIERQAGHLTRLVDDLLDISRVTFGTVPLQREPVDVAALAVAAAEAAQAEFEQRGVAFELRIASGARVHGDAVRLAQCLSNLLANAAKFTPRGGSVQLRVRREGDEAVVEVQDSGVGIRPGQAERIFDLFVQEHRSGLHGNKGLGIGLALTRRQVTLHGGTVTAHSDGEGAGSVFVLRLPVLPSEGPDGTPAAGEGRGRQASQPGATVLVVDDNVDAADTVAELLELSGVSTRKAYTGEEALQVFEAHGADALILDIGLPGIDGYEVCRRIRARTQGPQPVVVALTGWGQDSDRAHALEAGFDEHLAKPADIERLMAVLNRLLERGR